MSVYLCYEWHSAMIMYIFLALIYVFFGIFIFDKNNLGESIFILLVLCFPLVGMVFLGKHIDNIALKKINFSTDVIVMTSLKNRSISVDLSKSVYFQIVRTSVDKGRHKEFIILSNDKFEALSKKNSYVLGKICKIIDNDKTKIIAPYNEKTIPWLKLDAWTQIEQNEE